MTTLSVQLWEWLRSFIGLEGFNVEAFNFKDSLNDVFHILHGIWTYKILTVDKNAITIGTLTFGVILLVIGLSLSQRLSKKISDKLLTRLTVDISVKSTLESLTFYVLLIFFILFALKMANIPLTIFTVIGGALAIGIGFGSQNIVNNFISGLILMVERPVKVGDFIELDNILGQVEHIGMRSTIILSFGNKQFIVPNSSFLEKNVMNWTHTDKFIRINMKVGVIYGSPVREVEKLLVEALKSEDRVLQNREPTVLFTEFGDNSLNFEVLFWIKLDDLLERRIIESNIRFSIDELFRKAGIVIAFPQRDVHLYPKQPVDVNILNK